jgi:hypothetical protein
VGVGGEGYLNKQKLNKINKMKVNIENKGK